MVFWCFWLDALVLIGLFAITNVARGVPVRRAEAGSRPAGEVLFFASPKKSTQKKGDPTVCVPCASLRGNLRCSRAGCAAELAARSRAPLKQPQRVSSRSACVLRHTHHPARCAPRRIQRGVGNQTSPRAFASLGPISRVQTPRAAKSGPSEAMARTDVGCSAVRLPHPCWLRLRRGGCGVAWASERPCFVL